MPRLLRTATAAAALCLAAPPALAQSDKAGAEALLDQAVKLAAAHDYAGACPKFEESLRLYASLNTEYFLADCYEHSGKTASAWIDYLEVAEKARAAGETSKEAKARDRAHNIEAKVSHLTIQVGDTAVSDLRIDRDGVAVGRAQWGIAMPVDPGAHTVVASAPGHVAVTLGVTVKGDGDNATVNVPVLQPEPDRKASTDVPPGGEASAPVAASSPPITPPSPTPDATTTGSGQRVAGAVTAAAGVVALGVGAALAVSAKASYDGAAGCAGTVCQAQSSIDTRDSARNLGNVATVVVIAGAVVAAGGAVLWLTAPRTSRSQGAIPLRDWRLGAGPGTLILGGRF